MIWSNNIFFLKPEQLTKKRPYLYAVIVVVAKRKAEYKNPPISFYLFARKRLCIFWFLNVPIFNGFCGAKINEKIGWRRWKSRGNFVACSRCLLFWFFFFHSYSTHRHTIICVLYLTCIGCVWSSPCVFCLPKVLSICGLWKKEEEGDLMEFVLYLLFFDSFC